MNIENYSEKIKKHLPLILLVPTILGGLWQIIELSKISISYIRFFSPTQLLPDGLLILFALIILYVAYAFIDWKSSIYKPNIFSPLIRIVIFTVILFMIWEQELDASIMIIKIIAVIFIVKNLHILIIIFYKSKLFQKIEKYFLDKPILKELVLAPFQLLAVVILIGLVVIPAYLFSFFHNSYVLPKNLKNLENIQMSLKVEDYNQSKILYFNDKYIFIEHSNGDKNISVEVLMFEELF